MSLLKRANEQTITTWRPVDEGMYRWRLSKPLFRFSDRWNRFEVSTMLTLTQEEQTRLLAELSDEDEQAIKNGDVQQSFRTYYSCGWTLGGIDRTTGKYEATKMIDFLAACLGAGQTKKFREWIANGGGPPRPADRDDQAAEIASIEDWLGWWEDLEVYGTITHNVSKSDGKTYANFAGPLPVGSLPGQKDPDYDALGRGKLRALMSDSGETREAKNPREDVPPERYTQTGEKVTGDGSAELPWS